MILLSSVDSARECPIHLKARRYLISYSSGGFTASPAIVIMNPLGEDYSIMRTTSLNGMLTSLATNYNRRNKNVRLYEMGNIYIPKELPLTELPDERMQFTLGMYGDGDFFNMKGVVEEFFEKIGMKGREKYDPNAGKIISASGTTGKHHL